MQKIYAAIDALRCRNIIIFHVYKKKNQFIRRAKKKGVAGKHIHHGQRRNYNICGNRIVTTQNEAAMRGDTTQGISTYEKLRQKKNQIK